MYTNYLEYFITHYQALSYIAVFVGILLEGEVVFLTSAILATEGYLNWGLLVTVSLVGLLASDSLFYFLGRTSKGTRLGQWLNRRFAHYNQWLDTHLLEYYWQISFFSKFLYFVNKATPFLAGWRNLPVKRFFKVQIFSGVIWLGVMLIIGHILGLVVDIVGVKVIFKRIEYVFFGLIIIFFVLEKMLRKFLSKKISKLPK